MIEADFLQAETQDTEAKRIRSILQQSEDELRSELEMLKQQHEAELSRAVCLHAKQSLFQAQLINENY